MTTRKEDKHEQLLQKRCYHECDIDHMLGNVYIAMWSKTKCAAQRTVAALVTFFTRREEVTSSDLCRRAAIPWVKADDRGMV